MLQSNCSEVILNNNASDIFTVCLLFILVGSYNYHQPSDNFKYIHRYFQNCCSCTCVNSPLHSLSTLFSKTSRARTVLGGSITGARTLLSMYYPWKIRSSLGLTFLIWHAWQEDPPSIVSQFWLLDHINANHLTLFDWLHHLPLKTNLFQVTGGVQQHKHICVIR